MRQKDIRPAPAEIEFKGMKFLITDRPSDQNIHAYIQVSKRKFLSSMFVCNFGCINLCIMQLKCK